MCNNGNTIFTISDIVVKDPNVGLEVCASIFVIVFLLSGEFLTGWYYLGQTHVQCLRFLKVL